MNRLFEIQTLSECNKDLRDYSRLQGYQKSYTDLRGYQKSYTDLRDYSRLGFDPASIILAAGSILSGFFPNLFPEKSTMDHFNKLFPSNSYWTFKYKQWLLSRIKWARDIQRDILMYTEDFVRDNKNQFCPGCTDQQAREKFYSILASEQGGGGQDVLGGFIDWKLIAMIGGGLFILLALKKKNRSKK